MTRSPHPLHAAADALRTAWRGVRARPWCNERDLASPKAARNFNLIVGTAVLTITIAALLDPAAFATPWPWLVAPVAGYLLTHRVVRPTGVSFTFASPFMIATIVHGPATGVAIMVLMLPMFLLRGGASWRMAGRHTISQSVSCASIIWMIDGAALLLANADATTQLIGMALAASLADPVVLLLYFAPLIRLAEGRGFSIRAMLREEISPTVVQSGTEFSTAALGSIAVMATPAGWVLLLPPFVMMYHDSRLMTARSELLERLATDPLTGVRSRGGWNEAVHDAWEDERARPTYVVMADLDHFKQVNDRWGHATGDDVLRRAAQVMVDVVGDDGIVGRFGGEEFTLALCGSEAEVAATCERLRVRVGEALDTWGTTVSLGIALIGSLDQLEEALEAADVAVYLAKQSGRNQLARYDTELGPVLHAVA